jgi:hypothetical protein
LSWCRVGRVSFDNGLFQQFGVPRLGATKSIPGGCQIPDGGAYGTGTFVWPAANRTLSGNDYWDGHLAIDIAAATGAPIYATDSGVVVYAASIGGGYGNMVMIDHGNGYHSVYAHLSVIAFAVGKAYFKATPLDMPAALAILLDRICILKCAIWAALSIPGTYCHKFIANDTKPRENLRGFYYLILSINKGFISGIQTLNLTIRWASSGGVHRYFCFCRLVTSPKKWILKNQFLKQHFPSFGSVSRYMGTINNIGDQV